MTDKNFVHLEGLIVGDVSFKTATNEKPYCSFVVRTETKENNGIAISNVCVFVFDTKNMEYLKRVNAREGHRVCVNAYIRIAKKEIHGETIMQTMITVSDVHLIKTS